MQAPALPPLLIIPEHSECSGCGQECPKGTLFLGYTTAVLTVTCRLMQVGDAALNPDIQTLFCETCIFQEVEQEDPARNAGRNLLQRLFPIYLKSCANELFMRTVRCAGFFKRLFESERDPLETLNQVQEAYLRMPKKRTWIQGALCVAFLASMWVSTGIFAGAGYSLISPLISMVKFGISASAIGQSHCVVHVLIPLFSAQFTLSLIAITAIAVPLIAAAEDDQGNFVFSRLPIPYPIGRLFTWNTHILILPKPP